MQISVVSCGAAMSGCEKAAASWPAALQLLSRIGNDGHALNVITLSASISACQKSARWSTAAELLAGMAAISVQADVPVCNALIASCAKATHWIQVLSCLDSCTSSPLQQNVATYNSALAAFESGGWQEASSILRCMRSLTLKEDVITHTSVSNVFEKVLQWRRSLHRLRMLRTDRPSNQHTVSLLHLNSIVSACARAEHWSMVTWTCSVLLCLGSG